MICKNLMMKTFLVGPVLGATLSALIVVGCTGDAGHGDGRDSDRATVSRGISEPEGGDSGGEHGGRREGTESREEGGEGSGEHGPGGEEDSSTGSDGGGETGEAAMSSPIIPLGRSWDGVLGGLAVSMQYDAASRTVHGTVRNTLSQKLCYLQAEPHLKSGTKTVGELGPEKLGHLNPGQEATSSLTVTSEPELAGVSYDGYVVHMEVFDCSGPGPAAHTGGEGSEGSGEHGPGGEGGNEPVGAGGEEGSGANALVLDETFDSVRSGARLILKYHAASNSFKGTVENTTNGVLDRVRIEVHLSNGAELGPTTRRTWLQARWYRSTYLRRRHRSLDGQHMPRLAPEVRGASRARSTGMVAAGSLAANTAVVASGREVARANRSQPTGECRSLKWDNLTIGVSDR